MDDFQDMKDALNCPNDATIWKIKKDFATLDELVIFTFPSKIFENPPSVFLIELTVHEEITEHKVKKLKNFEPKDFKEIKVLITIKSTANEDNLILWKTESMQNYFCLKFSDPSLEGVRKFVMNEIKKWISNDHNGFQSNNSHNSEQTSFVDLLSLKCNRGYNLLMLAAEAGNLEIVQKFINLGFPINLRASDDKIAADLAWNNRHKNVLLSLLKADSKYPQNFDQDVQSSQLDGELKRFVTEVLVFYRHMHDGNMKEVQNFIEKNPQLRIIYNYTNLSAAAFALAIKKFNIYKLLLEKNIILPNIEDIIVLIEDFDESELKAIKKVQDEIAVKNPNRHIKLLTACSKISHNELNFDERMKIIGEVYQELDKIEQISPLLKCVAECRDLVIYFDFNREWTYFMDPNEGEDTNCRIYIAAKGLLDESMRNGNLGVIAHEICHYVSQVTFKNEAKPYEKNNAEHEKFLTELCHEYKKNENLHEIIASVFKHYPERLYHQEWIARAPHLMAFYRDDSESLLQCFEKYVELFFFYGKIFLSKVKESTVSIEKILDIHLKALQSNKKDNCAEINDKASFDEAKPHPMHVLEIHKINSKEEFKPHFARIDLILSHAEVKDRRIVIVSIIGEHRKGKSFFLDYCLRFMYANYSSISKPNKPNPTSNWMGNENEPLSGFSWKHGSTADTKGILFWSDVFLHDDPSDEKVAILFMDTQGLFEPKSTFKDNARIFSLSLLVSSVQILNIQGVIQENIIEYLEMATKLTKLLSKSGKRGRQWKPFQRFLFLIRDWFDDEIGFGYEGGEKYLKSFLESEDESAKTKAKEVRNNIERSFESIKCFLLSHPGLGALKRDCKGEWSKLEPDFVINLKLLIESLLNTKNLVKKSVFGNDVTAGEFKNFAISYFEAFAELDLPNDTNIVEILIENDLKRIVKLQSEAYQNLINSEVIDFNHRNFEMHMEEKHRTSKAIAINGFKFLDQNSDINASIKYLEILDAIIEEYFKAWQQAKRNALQKHKLKKAIYATISGIFGVLGTAAAAYLKAKIG